MRSNAASKIFKAAASHTDVSGFFIAFSQHGKPFWGNSIVLEASGQPERGNPIDWEVSGYPERGNSIVLGRQESRKEVIRPFCDFPGVRKGVIRSILVRQESRKGVSQSICLFPDSRTALQRLPWAFFDKNHTQIQLSIFTNSKNFAL